jgi:hypothetical protein
MWWMIAMLNLFLIGSLALSPGLAAARQVSQAMAGDDAPLTGADDEVLAPDEVRLAGVILSAPAGLIGDWTVGGKTVKVTAETRINQNRAPAQPGQWANVRALKQSDGSLTAFRIDVLPPIVRLEGPIMSIDSASGVWVIAAQPFKVDSNTRINEREGNAEVGAWVEVQAEEQSDGSLLALRIAVIEPKDDVSGFGAIQEVAADHWVVSRMTFNVTMSNTVQGPAEVGLLARFHGFLQGDALVVERIRVEYREWERLHLPPVVFQGVIESLPASGLLGEWVVSGRHVMVDASTEINQSKGPAEVGAPVHVEARWQSDGTLLATRIVVLARPAWALVRFRGVIRSMPTEGLVGEWIIRTDDGDRSVQVTERTWVDEHAGPAQVGARVQVEALRRENGSLWALRIKVLPSEVTPPPTRTPRATPTPRPTRTPQPTQPPRTTPTPIVREVEFEGRIQSRPMARNGLWRIAGQNVLVTQQTKIEEKDGQAVVGAWVKVKGWQGPTGPVLAREIEVKAPPAP